MSSNPSFANSNTTGASVPDSFLDPLRIVIGNPAIIALVEGAMKNDVSLDELIDQHIVAFTVGDRELYRPSYLIAVATWVLAQTTGDVLLHATNNITPYANTSQRPRTIPECALKELGLTSQHELAIAELHGLPNYLVSLVCSSRHELKARFGKFQALVQGAIFWLASCINNSIRRGFDTCINWGAYIGLKWDEFLFRVAPSRYDNIQTHNAEIDASLIIRVISEARRRGVSANEVIEHYASNDEAALTRYIPSTAINFPDITAWLHFPYDLRYPRTSMFTYLPQLLTNYSSEDEHTISSSGPPSSPAGSYVTVDSDSDVEMTDDDDDYSDEDSLAEMMSRLSINDSDVKMELTSYLPVVDICTSPYSHNHPHGLTAHLGF